MHQRDEVPGRAQSNNHLNIRLPSSPKRRVSTELRQSGRSYESEVRFDLVPWNTTVLGDLDVGEPTARGGDRHVSHETQYR